MISGATRPCFIFGDPIAHVQTPHAFNALAAGRGSNSVMIPLHVQAEGLAQALGALRFLENAGGAVVTLPHKKRAWELCDLHSERAQQCRAANVVRRTSDGRLEGDMLDGVGFVAGLERAGVSVSGARVLLAGAGGAASAIAFTLADAGAAEIAIHNRSPSNAEALADRVSAAFPGVDARNGAADPRGFDLIVNATPLGMRPDDPLPIDDSGLGREMVVAEAIMQPQQTRLLAAAKAAGARIHPGRAMLNAQLELIADFLGAASVPGVVET